jgi:hypothetical protein
MEELEQIVDEMINAGEDDASIQSVIKLYKSNQQQELKPEAKTPKKVPLNRSLDYMNLNDKDNDGYYDSTQTAVDQTKKAKTLVDDIISDVIPKGKKGFKNSV